MKKLLLWLFVVFNISNVSMAMLTPLHRAVEKGDVNKISDLLASDSTLLETADINGLTPIHWAVIRGRVQIVALLIVAKQNLNRQDRFGRTPLHLAVGSFLSSMDVFQLLMDAKVNLDLQDKDGETPLHTAVRFVEISPNLELAGKLIAAKANVNIQDKRRITPLHRAVVAYKNGPEITSQLIAAKATIDPIDANGCTPLHGAAHLCRWQTVQQLIGAGARLDIRHIKGCTPLDFALFPDRKAQMIEWRQEHERSRHTCP